MDKQQRVANFKKLGFGVFIHFGLFSILESGEWVKYAQGISDADYEPLKNRFEVKEDWAEKLVSEIEAAGARYAVLTTRHQDGFSLYDTKGLNDYDAPHSKCGRDLVREFTDACNRHGVVPIFFHTVFDWREKTYETDFKAYLKYLRASIEVLCKNYGKVGGFWFDGMWDKPDADWEEAELYGIIRKYQPQAVIVNNTGLHRRGAVDNDWIDVATFERGRPDAPLGDMAGEMCETIGSHWARAARDVNFKSGRDLLTSYMACRRYGANFLFNVGPKADGGLCALDLGILQTIGAWNRIFAKALRDTAPSGVETGGGDFVLRGKDGRYYLFVGGLAMVVGDANVVLTDNQDDAPTAGRDAVLSDGKTKKRIVLRGFAQTIKSARWIDSGEELAVKATPEGAEIVCTAFRYGTDLVWRVAELQI
ncbi:hypothetical protein FACS1894211_08640 [Clostridia bacterium]|nr:hypothetical protein FACS1894211_08640 [Clostridia bacterium]